MEKYQCLECGKLFNQKIYMIGLCSSEYFNHFHIKEIIAEILSSLEKGECRYVLVKRDLYQILADDEIIGYTRGFGGRKFTLQFDINDSIIETNNLWHLYSERLDSRLYPLFETNLTYFPY